MGKNWLRGEYQQYIKARAEQGRREEAARGNEGKIAYVMAYDDSALRNGEGVNLWTPTGWKYKVGDYKEQKYIESQIGSSKTKIVYRDPGQPAPGEEFVSHRTSSGTTRSPAEQARIEQKHAEITLQNIGKGTAHASPATIQRLEQQAARPPQKKDFVEAEILTQQQLAMEKERARQQRIVETKQRIATPPRKAGYTDTGGIYNIPKTAVYSPGYSAQLAKPSDVKAAAILTQYREQAIDTSKLPKGSEIEGKPASEYPSARLEPSPAALGNIARGVKYQQDLKRREDLLQGDGSDRGIYRSDSGIDRVSDRKLSSVLQDSNMDISGIKSFQKKIDATFEKRLQESRQLTQFAEQEKKAGKFGFFSEGRQAQVLAGISYVGLRGLKGFSDPYLHPVQSIKRVANLFFHPIESGKYIAKEVRYDPAGTIAEFAGFSKGVGVITKPLIPTVRATSGKIKTALHGKTTPYKSKPGLQKTTKIVPVVRPKERGIILDLPKETPKTRVPQRATTEPLQRPAIERPARTETSGVTRGLIAERPTTGADFKGISRIPPREPKTLTQKGNIISEEIGKKEGEILKPEKPRAKIIPFGFSTIGSRAIILATKTPEGLKLGKADISKYLPFIEGVRTSAGYKIAGAKETALIIKALRRSGTTARAREAAPTLQNILRRTRFTTSRYQRGLPKETERLPRAGVDILKDITKREQGVIFGGYARATQLADVFNIKRTKYERIPRLRDIDIRFDKATPEQLQAITGETLTQFKRKGIKAREIKDIPFAIEVRQPSGKYEKAVEFKGKDEIIKGEEVPEFVLGFRKAEKPTKVEGIPVTKLREELRGVTQGVARLRYQKGVLDIFPPEKRSKDIGSVVVSGRTLLQSKRIGKTKLEKDIEKFESLYPEKLVMQQLRKPKKVLLKDFTRSPSKQSARYGYSYLPVSGTRSPYPSISKSVSRSASKSPSISKSISRSVSRSVYKSPSSKSPSPSVSKSTTQSVSRTPSPSVSKSVSRSVSTSPSPSPSISISRTTISRPKPLPLLKFRDEKPSIKRKKKSRGYDYFYREFKLKPIRLNVKGVL